MPMKSIILLVTTLLFHAPLSAAPEPVASEEQVTRTLVWPDGTRYVGGVVDGKRTGKGTIFWQDGTRFVGQFSNDMRNGPGTMILPDGTVYTGFFKNDVLVDTESTIAASNASSASTMDEEETRAALGDTNLPMEADSLVTNAPAEVAQVDENDLIEPEVVKPEIKPESEPSPQATAETKSASTASAESNPFDADVTQVTETAKAELIETLDLWAAAWEDQNVVQYLENYSTDFAVPGRQSRRTWEALRRTRLARPKYINVGIVYQRFEFVETNVIDVFFRQTYRSDSYSDLTDKVVRMKREDNRWKILLERSR